MFSLKSNARGKNNDSSGQLKKLRRQDLLELLVEQLGENERLSAQIDELQAANAALTDQVERLKGKLDDKDVQIDHLKVKLDDKDRLIDRLKTRLDDKDTVLAECFEGIRELTEIKGDIPRESLLRLEGRKQWRSPMRPPMKLLRKLPLKMRPLPSPSPLR